MKRKLVLLMIPALMLSGCTLLDFNLSGDKNDPDDAAYRPTVVIREEEKGEEIALPQAEEALSLIKQSVQSRSNKLQNEEGRQEVLNELNKVSYDFKVKMDDYYVLDGFDFSKNDSYLHTSLHAEVPETDLSKSGFTVNKVDVVNGKEDADYHLYKNQDNRIVEATKLAVNGQKNGEEWQENSKYYELLDESVNYDEFVTNPLCQSMIFVGEQTSKLMDKLVENMDKYVSEENSGELAFGGSISFRSKGEGHLYIETSMPVAGLEMTVLFDNSWLTYGYMHINLQKAKEYGIVDDNVVFDRMTTELSVDFSHANVDLPDLSEYTAK